MILYFNLESENKIMKSQTNWWYYIPAQIGIVPFAYGSPGIGKTEIMQSMACAAKRNFILMLLDQHEPEDLSGFPIPSKIRIGEEDYGIVKKYPMQEVVNAKTSESLMLIDEFTCVNEPMQAAALTFMASPPDSCWVFAAGNPTEQAANGHDLTDPMVNRMVIGDWEIDKKQWAKGMTDGGGFDFPEPKFPIVPEGWKECTAFFADKINTFVNTRTTLSKPEYFNRPNDDESRGTPFPSPRSWTNAARLLGACSAVGANKKTQEKIIAGCVGKDIAAELLDFMEIDSYVDPEEILANPRDIALPKQANLAMSYVKSVLVRVKENCTPERWENAREFLATVHKQHPEFAKAYEQKLIELKPEGHDVKENNYVADMEEEWINNLHE